MARIPAVREWIVRTQWGADLRPTRYLVTAPTRTLAILNLRAADPRQHGSNVLAPIVSGPAVARRQFSGWHGVTKLPK